MPEMTEYPSGTFCWPELATSDAAAAKRFYGELFEWDPVDSPAGPDMVYTMLQRDGKNVGALYQLREELQSSGVRPRWLSYVSVADVDATADQAKWLGGKLFQEPFDVFEVGRMAIVEDPTGAVFALWQPRQHIGAELVNEPGALCWNELLTRDVPAAAAFYTELFGWTSQEQEMGGLSYTVFMNGDRPAGGLLAIQPEWGEMPPQWDVYFAVDDCDVRAAKAAELGAQILVPASDLEGVGRFATMCDPQGAMFSMIQLADAAA